MPLATVVNSAARGVISVSASRGVDVASLIREAGVDEERLGQPGARLPLDSVIRLWERARRTTRDESLALHVAEFLPFGAYQTYDLFLATAPTVGEALVKAAKFNGFVNDAFRPTLRRKRDAIWIDYTNSFDPLCNPPEYMEFVFACFLLRFRQTTGVNLRPTEIHFRHPPPRNTSEHERIFQAPVRFRQGATRAIIDLSVLRIPQLLADPATSELLEHYIQASLNRAGVYDDLTAALRASLSRLLSSDSASLGTAARELGMSRRGLQRKLAARGTSFRGLLQSLRYQLALTLLSQRHVSMNEAADALGFAELSSFSRAFKRWTGASPQAYRHRRRGGVAQSVKR
jgi:AraC-like DNA-binding protein